MIYASELTRAMTMLSSDPRTLFIGQAVGYPGTGMYNTLEGVPVDKRLELPVAEELQMGMTLGLALAGCVPISIFPRWNFLLLAMNQLVNHIDKRKELFVGATGTSPIIIRTAVGSERPLHPRSQHVGDFTDAVQTMAPQVNVRRLNEPEEIFPAYQEALVSDSYAATILVEFGDFYNEK